ncbi:hypothetical protein CULT_630035 [[Clostridium] ultunense Esp]|nr:hypothetical protein CULT_630035 [[Clostridium] ultunense Esp]
MSTFNDLEKRIQETEEIMRLCKINHRTVDLPEYLSKLEITSLQLWLDQLKREQQAEENKSPLEELEIKIDDKKNPSGQISVRTLTTILADLQALTDSIANTLYNQPSNRGPIPQEIIDSNSWILKTVKAGSFIAVLHLKHEHQLLDDEIPQRQMMIELFNLFHASDEEESLSEMISKLGMRTLKHYTEWTKNIRNLDVPVELNWKTKNGEVSTVSFDAERAGRIFTILNEKLTLREEETFLEGRLTGI